MKLLLTTIAAVLIVGCGPSEADKALLDAASEGDIEAVKQQLAAGANANAQYNTGWTALHGAGGVLGHKEIAELLIQNGADVNAKAYFEKTPLHEAAQFGHKEVVELLIANGADVNAKNQWGETPLHDAASRGLKKIIELLIAKGANVNAKEEDGDTPLDKAKYKPEISDLLRKHGGKTGEELKAEGK